VRPEKSPDFEKKLGEFSCQQCNECCRQPGFVYLDQEEVEPIASYMNMSASQFVNEHCEIQDRTQLVLKKHADEACIFLSEKGCSIHAVKPAQCRSFPTRWRTRKSFEYCVGLKQLFGPNP
jgi:uncharacterized protein